MSTSNTASVDLPTVILVHGLWMSGLMLRPLEKRLLSDDHPYVRAFSYASVRHSMDHHARSLVDFVRQTHRAGAPLHFVAHSLGGLVVLRALELDPGLPQGRIVMLGSPLQGSRAAAGISRLPFGARLIGSALREEAIERTSRSWIGTRQIGVIAGNSGIGLGRFFADLEGDHDGTVRVVETQMAGVTDHMVLPVSHTGLIFNPAVANQVAGFLRNGRFSR